MPDIFEAIDNCDLEEVKEILRQDPAQMNSLNENGDLPLFYSTYYNCDNSKNHIIAFLLENTKELNLKDKSNDSLVFAVLELANVELLSRLIDNGLDVNSKDSKGNPLIFFPVKKIMHLGYAADAYGSILGNTKFIKEFGEPSINRKNTLMNENILFKLIDNDADINAKDINGKSLAFIVLSEIWDGDLLCKLIDKGAILEDDDKSRLKAMFPNDAEELIKKSDENKAKKEAISKAKKEYSKDLNSLRLVSKNSEQNYILIDSLPAEANFHIFKQIRPAALTEKEAGQVITKRDRIIYERRQQENFKGEISR